MRERLQRLVWEAFTEGGPVSRGFARIGRSFTQTRCQIDYALRVAETFTAGVDARSAAVSLLEAETGTGKSLGYLIPMTLYLAICGKRGLVSTFTLQLLNQMLEEEIPLAVNVAHEMTGVRLRAAPRIGLANWFSPTRIAELIDDAVVNGTQNEELDLLRGMLKFSRQGGSIRDWEANFGSLPQGIAAADVCLLSSKEEDAALYRDHVRQSHAADILVVPHALLARSLMCWHKLLDPSESSSFEIGVIDEADTLPEVIRSLFHVRVSAPMIERVARLIGGDPADTILAQVTIFRNWMENVAQTVKNENSILGAFGTETFISIGDPHLVSLKREADKLAQQLSQSLLDGLNYSNFLALDSFDREEYLEITRHLSDFSASCANMSDYLIPALTWSPILKFPAFSVIPLNSARAATRLWRLPDEGAPFLKGLVVTSATLDAPGEGSAMFRNFRSEIGIVSDQAGMTRYVQYLDQVSGRFAPESFGTMRFRLSAPVAPNPSEGNNNKNSTKTNPLWFDYAAKVLQQVREQGGRSLVLTTSFSDTELLSLAIRDLAHPVIEHRRGTRLSEVLAEFVSTSDGMLISPSAWEGVNLPGLLTHIVITRLPFPTLSSARNQMMMDAMVKAGRSEEYARSAIFTINLNAARRKLKQGLGRGIRIKSDACCVWILDPRFPLPDTIRRDPKYGQSTGYGIHRSFSASIPARFREGIKATYPFAEIITVPS